MPRASEMRFLAALSITIASGSAVAGGAGQIIVFVRRGDSTERSHAASIAALAGIYCAHAARHRGTASFFFEWPRRRLHHVLAGSYARHKRRNSELQRP